MFEILLNILHLVPLFLWIDGWLDEQATRILIVERLEIAFLFLQDSYIFLFT